MKNITGIESSVLSQIAEANKKTASIGAFKNSDAYDHEECFDPGSENLAKNACEDSDKEGLSVIEAGENIIYSHLAQINDISKNPIGVSINQKA